MSAPLPIPNEEISILPSNEIKKKIRAHHNRNNYTLNGNTLGKLHNRLYEIDETAIENNTLPPPPPQQLQSVRRRLRFGGKRKTKKMRKNRKSRRNRKSMKNRKSRKSRKH